MTVRKSKALFQSGKISSDSPRSILFLGYGLNETAIYRRCVAEGYRVEHRKERVVSFAGYDLVVSFGYRHIISKTSIESANCPILNLHISLLPFNRGAHPNFWSFYDDTPKGVSIHLLDEGIDTGPIVYQKIVEFNRGEITFKQTYERLIQEVEELFLENFRKIIDNEWTAIPQKGNGSYHTIEELPECFAGWDSNIEQEISRLRGL